MQIGFLECLTYECLLSYLSYTLTSLTTEDCYTGDTTSYTGKVSVTESGRTCQAWSSQFPHEHATSNKAEDFPDGYFPFNYCRNPPGDQEERPWCYTTDPDRRWELCDVRDCATRQGNMCDKVILTMFIIVL